jgi:hypothetical protein
VAAVARAEGRAVVTGNVADFAAERDVVLVFVLKKNLPAGGGQSLSMRTGASLVNAGYISCYNYINRQNRRGFRANTIRDPLVRGFLNFWRTHARIPEWDAIAARRDSRREASD